MDTKSTLHCKIPREVKALITSAAASKGQRLTGAPGKLTPWVTDVLISAALEELGLDSLEDWISNKSEAANV